MNYPVRFRAGKEIIAEVLLPDNYNHKLIIYASGLPSAPKSPESFKGLIALGYGVVTFRYRGSWESDGLLFKEDPYEDFLILMDQIGKGVVDLWTKKEHRVKYKELIVIGSSFGGPLALKASLHKKVDRVIVISGVVDWVMQKDTDEPNERWVDYCAKGYGKIFRFDKKGLKKVLSGSMYNPVGDKNFDIKKIIMMHSKDDEVVHYKHTLEFCRANSIRLITFKKGGHMGSSLLNRLGVLKKLNL